jgi:PAS domain S-box-containing protein
VSLPDGGHVVIMDRDGVVLASSPGNATLVGKPVPIARVRDAIKAGVPSVFDGTNASGARKIYALRPSSPLPESPFFVLVSADRSEVLAPARERLALNLFALTLIALFGSWMAWLLAGRAIVKPAAEILAATGRIQAGELDVRLPVRPGDGENELTRIASGFNSMADSLQQREREQAKSYAELRQTQSRLLAAQKLGRIGHWDLDMRSNRLAWSDELHDLFGLKPGEFDGDHATFLKMIHPGDRERYDELRAAAYVNGTELKIEYRIITPAGDVRWMHQRGQVLVNEDGRPLSRSGVVQDITQRKEGEKALRDSEQRYAALFEMAPVPMWVFDPVDHRFLAVNRTAVENYGYSADEFRSMTIFDIREESDHTALRNQLLQLTASRQSWQHRRKDGSFLTVNVVAKSIQFAGREACFVVALDVTARINAEKDVQDQLFTLQRAADAALAITMHQTVDGMLQEVAEQARGVIGAHQSVVSLTMGKDWLQASNALSMSEKYARYRNLRDPFNGSGIYAMVSENNRAVRMTQAELEAHPRWRNFGSDADKHPSMRGWLAVPLKGHQGQDIGLLQLSDKYEGEFTLQDEYVAIELAQLASIAIENARLLEQVRQFNAGLEQKVTERTQALARQEALFRALAEQAPQVIWTVDNKGEANYFNRAFFDLVGGTLEDWAGRKWSSVIHPEDLPGVLENWAHALATRSPFVGIRRICGRDGSYHVMSYRASPVLDEHGEVSFWVGIDADITEIKSIESALRLSNEELEAFSYSVSHDLRAPLNTIDGFSRLLGKQITNDVGSKAQHYLTRIQAGVAQMGKLIEDLLSLSQVSRMQLHHELVDLSVLSRRILDDWQARDPHRQVEFHIEPGLVAQGDARLVRVLMENLLGNAWKFTSQRANANITVGQQPDAAGLPVFFVRDDGAGFDMAYADKLFVAFQRLHHASEFHGTGVGLATVSRVIGRHGGKLWADASPGKGATFFFTLPKVPMAPLDDDV